jgi:hypothetical protein
MNARVMWALFPFSAVGKSDRTSITRAGPMN